MKQFFYNTTLIILGILLGLVVYSFYLLFYPVKTIEFKQQPLIVLDKEIQKGEDLQYVSEYCKYIDKPAWVSRYFIDGLVFTLDPITTDMPIGCHTKIVSIKIPETLPKGTYSFKVVATYTINPLRSETITWQTEEFNVIKEQEGNN
jgi:hypothetical protein